MPTAADVVAAFSNRSLQIDPNAINTCVNYCTECCLSAEDFVNQWDAHSMNTNVPVATLETLATFRAVLQEQAKQAMIKTERVQKENIKHPINHHIKPLVKKEPFMMQETPKKRNVAPASFQSPDAKKHASSSSSSIFSPTYIYIYKYMFMLSLHIQCHFFQRLYRYILMPPATHIPTKDTNDIST